MIDRRIDSLLNHLWRGGDWGYYWTLDPTTEKKVTHWVQAKAHDGIPRGQLHVYFGVNPTGAQKGRHERAHLSDIAAINCLFAEYDAKDYKGGKIEIEARIDHLKPPPSIVIDSGGGFHCYWLIDKPYTIDTEERREKAKELLYRWVEYVQGDTVKDLARVLRVPGTTNYKPEYGPDFPQVYFVFADFKMLYSVKELVSYLPHQEQQSRANAQVPSIIQVSDNELLSKIRRSKQAAKFIQLYDRADTTGYKSHSEADAALCSILTSWTGADAQRTDTLFRLSALMRDKWDTKRPGGTYGSITIDNAIKTATWFYDPQPKIQGTPAQVIIKAPDPELAQVLQSDIVPPLPEYGKCEIAYSEYVCPWLHDYIAYSRKWSPRAFDGFHEAVGIWILSTIAARRVMYHDGGAKFTPLYVTLAARSSLYAKSTTAQIGLDVLRQAGLGFMLAADDATPQKFITDMTNRLPSDYFELTPERQTAIRLRMGFAGQRGWFYEEFGQKVAAMLRDGGFMADFRGILRKFDDCLPTYEYGTIGRGTDFIKKPYLALLANITPADLAKAASRGSALWSDGFLARFALVTPPPDFRRNRERFPQERRASPPFLVQPLQDWHKRLGRPTVVIPGKDEDTAFCEVEDIAPQVITLHPDVIDARYNYLDALTDLIEARAIPDDLASSYVRLPEKALRIMILICSLNNETTADLQHWALAWSIAERWRASLHSLYEQISENGEGSAASEVEELIFKYIPIIKTRKGRAPTARELGLQTRKYSTTEMDTILTRMVGAGVLVQLRSKSGRTKYYDFNTEDDAKL